MPNAQKFHLNYYVGAMLAQGGDMWLDGTKIIFSPTISIDRALAATDVEIHLDKIKEAEYKGDVRRWFHVQTTDKVHKFQGTQAKEAWDYLKKVLRVKTPSVNTNKSTVGGTLACHECAKPIE